MSISSTPNTLSSPSSSLSSTNSTPQPGSLRATPSSSTSSSGSPPLLCDKLTSGDVEDEDNIFRKNKGDIKDDKIQQEQSGEPLKQQEKHKTSIIKTNDKLETTTAVARQATSSSDSCHHVKTTTTTTTTTTSISSIRKIKPLSAKPEIVASVTPAILKRTISASAQSALSKSKDVVVTNAVGGCTVKAPKILDGQQSLGNKWRLSTKLETTCNILSRSAAISAGTSVSSSPSSISSRQSDLVASSSLPLTQHGASQMINFKTIPLLMNHNHHFQPQSTTSGSNNIKGDSSSSNKSLPASTVQSTSLTTSSARPLISTLSPQIILSQIITTKPAQHSSHVLSSASNIATTTTTATGAKLDGIQFCLNSTNSQPNSNILQIQSLTSTPTPVANTPKHQTSTGVASQPTESASQSLQARVSQASETKPKVKLHTQSSNKGVVVDINSAIQGDGGTSNIAAARLLDLGKKLLEASREGKLDQVRHLIEDSGAPFTSDWLGTTALHFAAQGGHALIAEVLVRAGVNRDARTKLERTALHLAAQSGSLEIVDLLLTHGSDVNARDMLRMTPLHWAVERGHVFVAERLLISGADAESPNKFLLTPLDIARELGSHEMMELFKNWTGDSKDDQNLEAYSNDPGAILNESQDFLDIDYHLALVDSATNSQGGSTEKGGGGGGREGLGTAVGGGDDDPCIDLVEFEWNNLDFDPDLFLPSEEGEEEQKVDFLMKVVEDLKKENQLLRQKVEQLSTADE